LRFWIPFFNGMTIIFIGFSMMVAQQPDSRITLRCIRATAKV